jgi:integrase
MVLAMSRPHKHPKTGIFWLRKRVPADLVDRLGRKEVTRSLGTRDPAEAKPRYTQALAEIEAHWENLRRGERNLTEREAHALAAQIYENWLAAHRDYPSRQVLWRTDLYPTLWTAPLLPEREAQPGVPGERPIYNVFLRSMRKFCLKQADLGLETYGFSPTELNRFILAKAVAAAVQRASRILEREENGIFEPGQAPASPAMHINENGAAEAEPLPVDRPALRSQTKRLPEPKPHTSLSDLLQGWWQEAQATGLKPSTHKSYRQAVSALIDFLGHDDASRVRAEDVVRFKEHRLTTPSRRTGKVLSSNTVKSSDLAALKAVFGWAVENHKMTTNPASGVKIRVSKPPKLRSKGFTDAEAEAILRAAFEHKPGKENPKTAAAKRWVPWLCAFTGGRVGELAQLRKQDVTQREGHWVIRITPEAGTVKNNEAREVTLHPQLVALGFPAFVATSSEGHLFLTPASGGVVLGPLQGLKNRLAEFARAIVPDENVAPNHGWRHRFKTIGLEAGISPRILDAIQGQAPRSVAESYGEATLKTIAAAINKLPAFDFAESRIGVESGVEYKMQGLERWTR